MSLKLLLATGDAGFAATLAAALGTFGHDVHRVDGGAPARAAIGCDRYDAAILDRAMPRPDGLALIRTLRTGGLTIPVVLLAAAAGTDVRIAALEAGADDCLDRAVSAAELDARLRAVLRGRGWSMPGADTLRAGDIVVNPASFRAWRDNRPLDLGRLELRLLAELVRSADAVLTRSVLFERVWGTAADPKSNIVDAYIRRVRAKLMEAGGGDPILTVRGVGYTLRR